MQEKLCSPHQDKDKIAGKVLFTPHLILLAFCSLAGLFSGFYWFFDLFNHFRPQAVVAGIILLMPMLFYKDRAYIFLALAVILLNSALIAGRIYAFSKNTSADVFLYSTEAVSIISANVHTENTNYAPLIHLIEEDRPDVFIAIEVNDEWIRHLKEIETIYPYSLKHPRQDNFGVAIYSKTSFKGMVLEIGDYKLPSLLINFKNFILMTMHPIPPTSTKNAAETFLYFSEASKIARQTKLPLIIAGDLNTTLWSDNVRPFLSAGLAPANPSGIAWTWPVGFLPFAIEIDHIFVRNAAVRSFSVLKDMGSDHYPIKVRVSFP